MNISTSVHAISGYLLRFDEPLDVQIEPDRIIQPQMETESEQSECQNDSVSGELDLLRIKYNALLTAYEEQKSNFEQAIEIARCEWVAEESENLSKKLINVFNTSLENLRVDISRVLAPILSNKISQISYMELNDVLDTVLATTECPFVRIEGSSDLFEEVKNKLTKHEGRYEIIAKNGSDISVRISNVRIETRLEDWQKTIQAIVE